MGKCFYFHVAEITECRACYMAFGQKLVGQNNAHQMFVLEVSQFNIDC